MYEAAIFPATGCTFTRLLFRHFERDRPTAKWYLGCGKRNLTFYLDESSELICGFMLR